jgi:predicted polyphosphate/ATP-dependent NAD kinase
MTVGDYTSAKDFLQFKKEIRGSRAHLIVGIGGDGDAVRF